LPKKNVACGHLLRTLVEDRTEPEEYSAA